MKKRMLSWGVVTVFGVLTCMLLVIVPGSLWFLTALLGDSPGQYSVGYYNSFLGSSSLAKSLDGVRGEFLPPISDRYNRFVYKKDVEGEYIVGIPRLSNQLSIMNDLKQGGWEGRRIGLIVIASNRGDFKQPQYSLKHAMGKALQNIFLKRLPLRPVLVLRVDSIQPEAFSLYAENSRKGLHVVLNTQSSDFSRGVSQRTDKNNVLDELTYVALQRDVLSYLPSGFEAALERKISESMHFTKTQPRMFKSLLSLGPVSVTVEGDSVAIGLFSSDIRPATLINEWINEEQGTRHPIKKAFALPDKTLGYEYVPGLANAYFDLNKGKNNCLPTEKYDEHLFLCGKDQSVVLANDQNIGNQLLTFLQDRRMDKRGVIQGDAIKAIGLSDQFDKIEYIILDETIEVWADSKSK